MSIALLSLESIAGTVGPRPDNVVPGPNPAAKPESVRRDKPHVSVYLDKRVQKVIKEIALAYDRKPHDSSRMRASGVTGSAATDEPRPL
jgi:hypothetical protein